jgi:hypothetical protein
MITLRARRDALGPRIAIIEVGGGPRHAGVLRKPTADAIAQRENLVTTIGKTIVELTRLANEALRDQPGCATAIVPHLDALPDGRGGRNWEIPQVILGDSLISDVDRAVLAVHHQLGRKFHLVVDA